MSYQNNTHYKDIKHSTILKNDTKHYKTTAYLATILNANLSIIVKCFQTKNTSKHPIADAAFILLSIQHASSLQGNIGNIKWVQIMLFLTDNDSQMFQSCQHVFLGVQHFLCRFPDISMRFFREHSEMFWRANDNLPLIPSTWRGLSNLRLERCYGL